MMMYISTVQYGTLILKQSYAEDTASKDYISDQLSLYFLIAQLSGLAPALLFGLIIDRTKVWRFFLLWHCFMLASLIIFINYVPGDKHIYNSTEHAPHGLVTGFILMNITSSGIFTLNQTLMAKSVEKCNLSRGVFMGAQAMCSGLGILLIDGVGGNLYDSDPRNPFYMCIGSESVLIAITAVLALADQLHV